MQQSPIDSIRSSREYTQLARMRRRFSFSLTALMILAYYGFILCCALEPRALAHPLYAGATISVGVVAGIGVMLIAIVLTGWYVRHTDRRLDPLMNALLVKAQQGN